MTRPVLVTVDDDPTVSRAIARDLRRRYAATYRVVRSESGPDALDAIRQLTLRGEQVAVVIADHRMPGMTGVEFLEQAMDLVPEAKRVLLTAYADTDAAIRAINEVDLDRYLLKPWDPPEERLFPPLDDLLEDWAARRKPDVEGVRVVGHRWSRRSSELKDFLARNGVPYEWLDSDSDTGKRLLEVARATAADLPVVLAADGTVLVAPDTRQVATALGFATTAALPFYDVVVVGGGPAGLGAAVYAGSEGLRTLLVERAATGGQAGQSSRIENYLGFPAGISGGDLARRARDQASRFGVEILAATEATALEVRGRTRIVQLDDGSEVAAHAVVLATGVDYTRLPADGADGLSGRGVFYGAAGHEAVNCRDQAVYLVGGANSAGQAAVHFSRYAGSVTLLVRGESLTSTMSAYLIDQVGHLDNVAVRTCTEVVGATGDGHLETLALLDKRSGAVETVPASWLFVFIGAAPRTDWLSDQLARDQQGFLLTGPDVPSKAWPLERAAYHLESSVPGIFVAGDVRHESVKRVAGAVGEGATAITLVHRYLATM